MEEDFSLKAEEFSKAVDGVVALLGLSSVEINSIFQNQNQFSDFQRNISYFQQHWSEIKQYAIIGAKGSHNDLIETAEKLREQMEIVSKANLKIASLEKTVSTQNAENAKLTLENIDLQKQLDEISNNSSQNDAITIKLREQISSLEARIESYKRQISEHQQIASSTKTEITDVQQELVKERTQNQVLMSDNTKLKTQIQQLQAKQIESETTMSSREDQIQQMQSENSKLTAENAKLKSQIQELQTKHIESVSVVNTREGQIEEMKTEKNQLTLENTKLKTQLQQLQTKQNDGETTLNALQEEVEQLRTENNQLNIDNTKYKAQLQQLQTFQSQSKTSTETLTQQLMEITASNQQLENDLSKYKSQVLQLQSSEKQNQASIQSLKRELETATKENIDMKAKVEALENEPNRPDIVALQSQMRMLSEKVTILSRENEEMKNFAEQKDQAIQEEREKANSLEVMVNQSNHASSSYQRIFTEMRKKMESFANNLSSSSQNIEQKLNATGDALAKLVPDIHDFETRFKALQVIREKESKNSIKLLSYAISTLSKLSGMDDEAIPSVSAVLQNPQILVDIIDAMTRTVTDLRSSSVQKSFNLSTHHQRSATNVSTSVGSMSSLMKLIGQQMEAEHEELMKTIGEVDAPSFRSVVSKI